MENNFKVEIISPEKIIFSDNSTQVTIPSYEGEMSILKNHISIITFLRPGIISTNKDDGKIEKFFVEDGIAEFNTNTLIILSSSILNIKELSKDFVDNLNKITQDKLSQKDLLDHDRYVLNCKLDVLKEIRI